MVAPVARWVRKANDLLQYSAGLAAGYAERELLEESQNPTKRELEELASSLEACASYIREDAAYRA